MFPGALLGTEWMRASSRRCAGSATALPGTWPIAQVRPDASPQSRAGLRLPAPRLACRWMLGTPVARRRRRGRACGRRPGPRDGPHRQASWRGAAPRGPQQQPARGGPGQRGGGRGAAAEAGTRGRRLCPPRARPTGPSCAPRCERAPARPRPPRARPRSEAAADSGYRPPLVLLYVGKTPRLRQDDVTEWLR